MGKGEFWPSMTSQSLKFTNLNLPSTIKSRSSTPVQIFISVRSAGASSHIREILPVLWLFPQFVGYTVLFILGHAPRSNPWMDFRGLWLIRRVFAQGQSFWGLGQYQNSFRGNIPISSPKGAWIGLGNFKPNGPNIKVRYLAKYKHDQRAILVGC